MIKQSNTTNLLTIKHPFGVLFLCNNSTMPTHSYRLSHSALKGSESQENHPFEVLPIVEGTVGVFEYNSDVIDEEQYFVDNIAEMY